MKPERWNPIAHPHAPLHWRKPRLVTVADCYDDAAWAVMALTPQHVYEVTATEPERMAEWLTRLTRQGYSTPGVVGTEYIDQTRQEQVQVQCNGMLHAGPGGRRIERAYYACDQWPLRHVRLGTTIRDQAEADAKLPPLLQCPAACRFVDVVPRGPVDLDDYLLEFTDEAMSSLSPVPHHRGIHHIRVRGESGPDAAPLHPDHVRSLRDQAVAAGVKFAFLGWGEWAPGTYGYDSESPGWISSVGGTLHMETMFPGDEDGVRMSAWAKRNIHTLTKTSSWCDPLTIYSGECMVRVGKRAAGRLLDGREWNEMPQTRQEDTR